MPKLRTQEAHRLKLYLRQTPQLFNHTRRPLRNPSPQNVSRPSTSTEVSAFAIDFGRLLWTNLGSDGGGSLALVVSLRHRILQGGQLSGDAALSARRSGQAR